MKSSLAFFLFLSFLHLIQTRVIGVSEEEQSLYSGTVFTCRSSSQQIPIKYINDDYCDCEDGSDEPGTSACAPKGHFYCANKGHKPLRLPSSRVNDLLCDCCDGSDENSSGVTCSNTCLLLGEEKRRKLREQIDMHTQGAEKKQASSNDSERKLKALEVELEQLKEQLKQRKEENELLQLQKQKIDRRKFLAERLIERRVASSLNNSNSNSNPDTNTNDNDNTENNKEEKLVQENNQNRDENDEVRDNYQRQQLNAKEIQDDDDAVEEKQRATPSSHEEEEADGEDDGEESEQQHNHEVDEYPQPVPKVSSSASHNFDETEENDEEEEEYVEGDYDEEDEDENPPTRPKVEPKKEDLQFTDQDLDALEQELEQQGLEPEALLEGLSKEKESEGTFNFYDYMNTFKNIITAPHKYIFGNSDKLNQAASESSGIVRDLENKIAELEKTLKADYGAEDEYYSLKGQCFESTFKGYLYHFCPFEKVKQDHTSLGTWTSWDDEQMTVMKYENGQSCWNAPSRSTRVTLICGWKDEIVAVEEPSTCTYTMTFTTPNACSKEHAAKLQQELDAEQY